MSSVSSSEFLRWPQVRNRFVPLAGGQSDAMSTPTDLLIDAYGRVPDLVGAAMDGLSVDQLHARLDPEANTVAWLVWHLARVQDVSIAGAFDSDPVWTAQDWSARFDLPLEDDDMGYGHSSEQVASVRVEDPALLTGYLDAVQSRSRDHLSMLTGDDLDRALDRSLNPPVTVSVRLVSVLADCLQHAGQAALLRGLLLRE